MPIINCAIGSLEAFNPSAEKPWDFQKAIHLHRRLELGNQYENIAASLSKNPSQVIDEMIARAESLPLEERPDWADWLLSDYSDDNEIRTGQVVEQIIEWSTKWALAIKNNGLRDRMSWFWHNHFVTRLDDYGCPPWMYRYHRLLQKHALGNFKDFVREIGLTPAMLVFLNGVQNTRFETNENFARELYELFTLGVDNGYTQQDIVETGRALTGWNGITAESYCGDITFTRSLWDAGEKTIFGRTGNWDYEDVINILFEEKAVEISEFICGKLYQHFVNPIIDEQVIADLAQIFRENNFELKPVLSTLFKSEHFFDVAHIGAIIPGHIEYFFTFLNEIGYQEVPDILYRLITVASEFDQRMFNPTDVSGWAGNRNWITSTTFSVRTEVIQGIMGFYFQLEGETLEPLRTLAIQVVGDDSIKDPKVVTDKIIAYLLPKELQGQIEYEDALMAFKAEVPENYFESGQWDLNWEYAPAQVYFLILHLSALPEFQLK